jgi:SAM-dependent methyltransferase
MLDLSVDYYEQNAAAFFAETVEIDMTPLYQRFLSRIPDRAHILDAGCGSGRDAKAFANLGHCVIAFDASRNLVSLAETHLGRPVQCLRFQDIAWLKKFDGIWACASLLHVPAAELSDVMQRLCHALRTGGILYASFKYGSGERKQRGRRFTDLDEPGLTAVLRRVPEFEPVETWTTSDLRPEREAERWLNTLLRRTESTWASS